MAQDLLESFQDGVATLTMNRPEARNALSPAPCSTPCSAALPRLAKDPAVRLVVLTGAGRAFCSGGDVKGFARRAAGAEGGTAGGGRRPSTPRSPTCVRAWRWPAGCTRCPSRRWP
jgi:enoyl-CoA hydratase/carnithine racemase